MVDAGVAVTLNADDPLWFGASASDQYAVARQVWGMDDGALAALARTGARARGMGEHTRAALLRGVDAWLAAPAPAQEGRA
jgi:adenosine deaminase